MTLEKKPESTGEKILLSKLLTLKTPDYTFTINLKSSKEIRLPQKLIDRIGLYLQNAQIDERATCSEVASTAVKDLTKSLEEQGLYIGTIGTEMYDTPLQYYSGLGYKFHIMNFIQGYVGKNEIFLAVDFNARQTMPDSDCDVFIVGGGSELELINSLKSETGTKWIVR